MLGINPEWTSHREEAWRGGEPQAVQGTAVQAEALGSRVFGRSRQQDARLGLHEATEGRVGFLPQSSILHATWPGGWGAQGPEALLGLTHASGSRATGLFPLFKSYSYLFIVIRMTFSQVSLRII